jgi:hypothetical protein
MSTAAPQSTGLINTTITALSNQSVIPTREIVENTIRNLASSTIFGSFTEVEIENCLKRVLQTISVVVPPAKVLVDRTHKPWLVAKKRSIDNYYWERYRTLLMQKGIPATVLVELETSVESVLDKTFDPDDANSVDRRGLVMGNVQSGKTQHYIGLMTKAADAGYKVIIVIAGLHNSLRNQTQERVDEGFLGMRWNGSKNSQRQAFGVGRFTNATDSRSPNAFTASVKDFNIATAQSVNVPLRNLNEPAVFVIKKNKKTLETLLTWLETNKNANGKISESLLLIDDEADNASINTNGEGADPSVINSLIRSVLNSFSKSAYVAYTATPFANIFIDPETENEMWDDDLFPQSFIIGLEPPSNYLGPTKVFGDKYSEYLRDLDDFEDLLPLKHKSNHLLESIPESLRHSLRAYFVSRSIRTLRGQGSEHSAMMINASRFISIQHQIFTHVHLLVSEFKNAIQGYGALAVADAMQNSLIAELYETFRQEFSDCGHEWSDVLEKLWVSIAPIEILEVNMKASSSLDYQGYEGVGRHVIAIGGLSLSRGLTLEGLTISYYLRNTQMYDTLLQMGRWFGYRPGFEDLVRIWMPEASQEWYKHVTEVIEELRAELATMQKQNMTPTDFGLKVRRHPGSLMITARNKQGKQHRIMLNLSFNKRQIETYQMSTRMREKNLNALSKFENDISTLGLNISDLAKTKRSWFEIKDVPVDLVLSFLEEFDVDNETESPWIQVVALIDYIRRHRGFMELWDVAIPSLRNSSSDASPEIFGKSINCQVRSVRNLREVGNSLKFEFSNRRRLSTSGIDRAGLSDAEIQEAEELWNESGEGNSTRSIPDIAYRSVRKRPLLALHLVKPDEAQIQVSQGITLTTEQLDSVHREVFLGWGVSIHDLGDNDTAIPVEYSVTEAWLRNQNFLDVEEDDDIEE